VVARPADDRRQGRFDAVPEFDEMMAGIDGIEALAASAE
jgi:hypothetical protein